MTDAEAIDAILDELILALRKWPNWTEDVVHGAAILGEEAGEVLRAALRLTYEGGSVDDLRREVCQCGAMCLRMLRHLDEMRTKPALYSPEEP